MHPNKISQHTKSGNVLDTLLKPTPVRYQLPARNCPKVSGCSETAQPCPQCPGPETEKLLLCVFQTCHDQDAHHPRLPQHCLAYPACPEKQLHHLTTLSSKCRLNWSAYLIRGDTRRSSNSLGQILPQTPTCTS